MDLDRTPKSWATHIHMVLGIMRKLDDGRWMIISFHAWLKQSWPTDPIHLGRAAVDGMGHAHQGAIAGGHHGHQKDGQHRGHDVRGPRGSQHQQRVLGDGKTCES